jgi:hypothetical protein
MTTSLQLTDRATSSTKQKPKKIQATKHVITKTNNSISSTPQLQRSTRDELIYKNAYRMAEQRGFTPGHELDDWLTAEFEVNQSLIGNGFM